MLRHIFSFALFASLSLPAYGSDDERFGGVLAFSAPVEDSRGWLASPRPSPFTGIDYVQFDHKHWKPERLDAHVQNAIHGWIQSVHRTEDVKQQYKYLLSAACLGHHESMVLAGEYLLADKTLKIGTLSELPATVSKYMLIRLNRTVSSNKKLSARLHKLQAIENTTFDPFMGLSDVNKVRAGLKDLLSEKGSADEEEQLLNARIKDLVRQYSLPQPDERQASAVRGWMRKKTSNTVLGRLYNLQYLKTFDERLKAGAALIEETLNGYVIGEVCQVLRQSLQTGQSNYFDVLARLQSWGLVGALLGDARSMNEFWIASERLEDYEKAPILALLEQFLELVKSRGI